MAQKYFFRTVYLSLLNTNGNPHTLIWGNVDVIFPVNTTTHNPNVVLQGYGFETNQVANSNSKTKDIQAFVSIQSFTSTKCTIGGQIDYIGSSSGGIEPLTPGYVIASLIDTYEI